MPKIPDYTQLGGRPALNPSSAIIAPDTSALSRVAEQRGKLFSAIGQSTSDYLIEAKKQRDSDQTKLEVAIAENNLLSKSIDFERNLDEDYATYGKRFDEYALKSKQEALSKISNPEVRALFAAQVDNHIIKQRAKIDELAFKKKGEHSIAAVDQMLENSKELYALSDDATRAQIVNNASIAIDGLSSWLNKIQIGEAKRKAGAIFAELKLSEMSPEDRIAALSLPTKRVAGKPIVDSDEAIDFVIDVFEKEDFIKKDGKRGATKFGIHGPSNGLTDEQVASLTREDAQKIYKSKYWDSIDADNIPENIRYMVFDTAVNMGPETAKKWLKETGGDAEQYAAKREQHHADLIRNDPLTYGQYEGGWRQRDTAVRRMSVGEDVTGTIVDAIPFEKRRKLIEHAKADIKTREKALEQEKIKATEAAIDAKLENERKIRVLIDDPNSTIQQKINEINKMDMNGLIRDDMAVEFRRYLESTEKLNAESEPNLEADIVQRVYDVAAMAEDKPKEFLRGIGNIENEIMLRRSEGRLSAQSEAKLKRQIASLTSGKKAESAKQLGSSLGEARKTLEVLPPEYKAQATRELISAVDFTELPEPTAKMSSKEKREYKENLKLLYKTKSLELVDKYKTKMREKSVSTVEAVKENKPVEKKKDYSSLWK